MLYTAFSLDARDYHDVQMLTQVVLSFDFIPNEWHKLVWEFWYKIKKRVVFHVSHEDFNFVLIYKVYKEGSCYLC